MPECFAMYVACSTLCFSRLSLESALKAIRDLHFAEADLADVRHRTLTPEAVTTDSAKVAPRS